MKIPKRIQERRRAVRIEESLPFKIGHQGYDIQVVTLNISTQGAMCLVDRDIPVMTQLEIGFSLPGFGRLRKELNLQAKGVVVRKEKDPGTGKFFIAIYFSELKPKAHKLLSEFIAHRLEKDTGQ